ncbi:A disintegrin and metalloproteinase with thrombospondin motif 15 [Cricetulus griseus]|nr:A disintegrin and metalloproteinase with thrombospondin motif 15 [Cricetulus griseus]
MLCKDRQKKSWLPFKTCSREVRSVARAPQEEAAGGQPESWFESTPQPGGEDEEELESQELPRGSSGDTALSSGSPSSWQPLSPPQPPPAQQEESSTEEVLLRIPALSRDLYLLLRRDGRFLAQRFAVEQWPNPGPEPTRAEADPRPHTPPDAACFYTGTVLHHPGSLASFSTCGGGLFGLTDHFMIPLFSYHELRHAQKSGDTLLAGVKVLLYSLDYPQIHCDPIDKAWLCCGYQNLDVYHL